MSSSLNQSNHRMGFCAECNELKLLSNEDPSLPEGEFLNVGGEDRRPRCCAECVPIVRRRNALKIREENQAREKASYAAKLLANPEAGPLVERTYRCPDPCIRNCKIIMSSVKEKDGLECPNDRGILYGWIVVKEEASP